MNTDSSPLDNANPPLPPATHEPAEPVASGIAPDTAAGTNPAPPRRRRRSGSLYGTIARLPASLRQELNECLEQNVPYAEILSRPNLRDLGLSHTMLVRWRRRGFRDYLRDQRLLRLCQAHDERTRAMLQHGTVLEAFRATQQLISAQVLEAIATLPPRFVRDSLQADPKHLYNLLTAFSHIANGAIRAERLLADRAHRAALLEPKQPRKPATDEMIDAFFDQLVIPDLPPETAPGAEPEPPRPS